MGERGPDSNPPIDFEELGLKHKSESELFEVLLEAGSNWNEAERALVVSAYDLARVLHEDDSHRDHPYTYHLLRNANRVTGYLHINDAEIIAGTILHDSVEDHPVMVIKLCSLLANPSATNIALPREPLARQQAALEQISNQFSPRVAMMVGAVTNLPSSETAGLTYDEKIGVYVDKVRAAVETIEGWIIKFVDWEDNGLGIIHSDEPDNSHRLQHFIHKYGLVLPVLEARYRQADIQALLHPAAKAYIEHQFELGRQRLNLG